MIKITNNKIIIIIKKTNNEIIIIKLKQIKINKNKLIQNRKFRNKL